MAVRFRDITPLMMGPFLKSARAEMKQEKHKDADLLTVAFTRMVEYHKTQSAMMVGLLEKPFLRKGRPFFNVYPKILTAISKTDLSLRPDTIPKSVVHKLGTIAIKIPIGSCEANTLGTDCFIMSLISENQMKNMERQGVPGLFGTNGDPFLACVGVCQNGVMFSSCPMNGTFEKADDFVELVEDQHKNELMCQIALGIMLLAADVDYVKPILLKADQDKTTPLIERLQRARRRGVYGFTIGEEIERSPHFRRPHFAIRWTGKGGKIPKLVPVKGAVIGERLLTSMPTGYEDKRS